MSLPIDVDGPTRQGMLTGVRVLDISGPAGAYGARLLADLGADVVRVEHGPRLAESDAGTTLTAANGGQANSFERFTSVNIRSAFASEEEVNALAAAADVVLTDGTIDLPEAAGPAHRIDVTAFGRVGSGRDLVGDDLVALAAGGLLSLGGYPDTEPIAVFGAQAYLLGGIFAAVGALLALLAGDRDGSVHHVDVSLQAGIVGALEDTAAEADLVGTTRRRAGDRPREAGTGTYRCQNGYVAIVAGKMGTARAWTNLVAWLQESDVEGAGALSEPGWDTLRGRRRPEAIAHFRDVFERFSANRTKDWLYEEGQRRGIAIAPVNSVTDLRHDDQLADRQFFRTMTDPVLGKEVTYPGPPFRLSGVPVAPWRNAPAPGSDTTAVYEEWLQGAQRVDGADRDGADRADADRADADRAGASRSVIA